MTWPPVPLTPLRVNAARAWHGRAHPGRLPIGREHGAGAAVAYSILFAAQYAGGATPLAVLVGLLLCTLVAITIGQLAKHLPSAGGLATYGAFGLGSQAGFLVGWGFIMAELVVVPGGLLILGIVVSTTLHTHLGWPTWTWAPAVVLGGVIVWALVNSALAGSNASAVATTRVGYSLGRVGMLPRIITRTDPRYDTPANAVHVQAVLAIAYALILGFALGAPLKALELQGTISTTLIIAIYICTGVSCIVFYLRERRAELNVLLHVIVPLAAAVLFVPVLLAALGIDFAGLGIEPLASPANIAPYVAGAWMVVGVAVLVYFSRTDPRRIVGMRQVFGDPDAAEPPSLPSRPGRPTADAGRY